LAEATLRLGLLALFLLRFPSFISECGFGAVFSIRSNVASRRAATSCSSCLSTCIDRKYHDDKGTPSDPARDLFQMPRTTTRFGVRVVDGGFRTLFTIIEKPSGELIIPIKGAERFGPDWKSGKKVLEQRYSIHPSPKSAEFNVLKQTINLDGGESISTVALTDAVKAKRGFSILFARRCQTFADSAPEAINPKQQTYALAEFDPTMFNFMHAVFVGSPESEFDATDESIVITSFPFRKFKIVLMASLYALPSHHTTEMLHALTLPPEAAKEQEVRRFLMQGRSPEVCLEQYRNSVTLLARRFLNVILETEKLDPETVEMIRADLAKIGEVGLTDIELGPDQPKVHMLTSGPPPILRSIALHAGFLRQKGKPEGEGE
jgi:hypothetical protein